MSINDVVIIKMDKSTSAASRKRLVPVTKPSEGRFAPYSGLAFPSLEICVASQESTVEEVVERNLEKNDKYPHQNLLRRQTMTTEFVSVNLSNYESSVGE